MQKVSITIGNKKHFTDLDAFSQHIGKIGFFFCLFDRQRVTQHDKDYDLPYLVGGGGGGDEHLTQSKSPSTAESDSSTSSQKVGLKGRKVLFHSY